MEPRREYFYTVNSAGELYHDGTRLTDPSFLSFFFKRIRLNTSDRHTTFRYVSPCGAELNYVDAADAPFLFRTLRDNQLWIHGTTLSVPFAPAELAVSPAGGLYHPGPGAVPGRVAGAPLAELAEQIEAQDDGYVLTWEGQAVPLRQFHL
jgi:Domain of unknown function (DUF4505)